jgi:hypothetical protein
MGKFKYRAFITHCVSCKKTSVTLIRIGQIFICSACNKKLKDMKSIKVHNGGILKYVNNDNSLIYISPEELEVVEKELIN